MKDLILGLEDIVYSIQCELDEGRKETIDFEMETLFLKNGNINLEKDFDTIYQALKSYFKGHKVYKDNSYTYGITVE